ncbi:MAG: SpoIIE family protein phosphatase [Acidobacteria bacterium]|nr:SpoIIE family protein phosphatase [Acidobacteriota bacterium]
MARLEIINAVAKAANSSLQLNELLQVVVDTLGEKLHYESVMIGIYDPLKEEITIRAKTGLHVEGYPEGYRQHISKGLIGYAIRNRESVLVNDVSKDPRYMIGVPSIQSELVVPTLLEGDPLGFINVESERVGEFEPEDAIMLETISNQLAQAIRNAQLYESRWRQARNLGVIVEVSRELNDLKPVKELVQRIATTILKVIDYQIFAVLLLDESTNELEIAVAEGYEHDDLVEKVRIPVGEGLTGIAAKLGTPVRVGDVRTDRRYLKLHPRAISELAVPLIYQGKVIGVLDFQNTQADYFTEEHVEILTAVGSHIATSIANARLLEAVLEKERKFEREFRLAAKVQRALIPRNFSVPPGFGLSASFRPSLDLAGDYYEFLSLGPDRTGLIIGDVSGKGVSAAMLMAVSRSTVNSYARRYAEPATVLNKANRALYQEFIEPMYLTLFYLVLSGSERTILWSNGGHPPPLLMHRDGTVDLLPASGTVLGLFEEARYEQQNAQLYAGDLLVMYTDGITEARNQEGLEFGVNGIIELMHLHRNRPADQLADILADEAIAFSGRRDRQQDDISVVVLKCH